MKEKIISALGLLGCGVIIGNIKAFDLQAWTYYISIVLIVSGVVIILLNTKKMNRQNLITSGLGILISGTISVILSHFKLGIEDSISFYFTIILLILGFCITLVGTVTNQD